MSLTWLRCGGYVGAREVTGVVLKITCVVDSNIDPNLNLWCGDANGNAIWNYGTKLLIKGSGDKLDQGECTRCRCWFGKRRVVGAGGQESIGSSFPSSSLAQKRPLPKLKLKPSAWKNGRETNIRALWLASLDRILWDEILRDGIKVNGLGELVTNVQVKKGYVGLLRRATLVKWSWILCVPLLLADGLVFDFRFDFFFQPTV